MKIKFIIITLFISTIFCSCTSEIPIINDQSNPFIVNQIDNVGNDMCLYYGPVSSCFENGNLKSRPKIVLPKSMYNIGDTILLKK